MLLEDLDSMYERDLTCFITLHDDMLLENLFEGPFWDGPSYLFNRYVLEKITSGHKAFFKRILNGFAGALYGSLPSSSSS